MSSDSSDSGESEGQAPASHEPRECMACRGTGEVISNLGGTPTSVTCPWCGGTAVRVPGIDAQAQWREQQDAQAGEADSTPEPAA